MEEDELQGLVPFFVSTTLGTTGSCAFDNLYEIGQEIQKFPCVWLHVDAAYAGNSFICPELKPLLKVGHIIYNRFFFQIFACSTIIIQRELSMLTHLIPILTNGC